MINSQIFPGKLLCLFLFFNLTAHYAICQSKQEIAAMETQAKVYFEQHDYYKALTLYLKLDNIHPDNPRYIYPIIVGYMYQQNNIKALPYVKKSLLQPEKYPANLDYYAAKAFHLSHNFDEAITHYDIYLQKLKNSKKKKEIVKEIQREIENCKYAKEQIANPVNVKIFNLSDINSEYAEYGPVLSADQQVIIFTSCRPNTTGGQIDQSDGRYFEDIYIATKTENGWSKPTQIGAGINTEGHDASISLSPDGQKLLIFRNQQELIGGGSPGDLYISRLKGNEWTQATKLPENINTKAWEPSACLSADERILFFSSNREGGLGGTDLYMVRQLPNGEWALPMNLGPKINTPFDEDSPYLHPDGKTLYFSSNGHKTLGGYDIFQTTMNDSTRQWDNPKNLGYPINTAHDDIHFSWTADGRRVYFSSVRPEGKGDNDIYYADLNKDAANVMVIKGTITDSLSGQPVEATLKVYDSNTDELIGSYNSNSSTGKYIIILTEGKKYNITVEAEKYQLEFENYDISDVKGFEEVTKNIAISPK